MNSIRYYNVHSAIFLTALFLFLAIMILRFTLFCCFRELNQACCKKIKKYLRTEDIESENVFKELSMKHMLHEYKKTKEECEEIQEATDKRMKERLQKKMQVMMNEMKERIVKLNEKH